MLQFSLFRFPVVIQPSFWIMGVLMGYGLTQGPHGHVMNLVIWIIILFLSILWHELGHAFMFRRYGNESDVVLYSFGGLAIPQGRVRLTRGQDIVVSAAGPVFQLLIGLPLWWLNSKGYLWEFSQGRPFAGLALVNLMWVNLTWALVNLLPVYPLDGGRISFALFGPRRETLALQLSLAVAAGAAIYCLTVKMGFAALFFGLLAYNNWRRLKGDPEVPWMNGS